MNTEKKPREYDFVLPTPQDGETSAVYTVCTGEHNHDYCNCLCDMYSECSQGGVIGPLVCQKWGFDPRKINHIEKTSDVVMTEEKYEQMKLRESQCIERAEKAEAELKRLKDAMRIMIQIKNENTEQ